MVNLVRKKEKKIMKRNHLRNITMITSTKRKRITMQIKIKGMENNLQLFQKLKEKLISKLQLNYRSNHQIDLRLWMMSCE